jgi:hypothetical protein
VELHALPEAAFAAAHPALASKERAKALDPALAVERRSLVGGPARSTVVAAIADARSRWKNVEKS